ncbi:MAG: helix-turn-helix transcriptional regulator [Bryobacteraceae bacterium]
MEIDRHSAASGPSVGLGMSPAPAYGLNLADARARAGLSLEAIGRTTKIKLHFLEAIENEAFGALPEGVYALHHIRHYARAVGLDEAPIIAAFESYREAAPRPEPPPEPATNPVWQACTRFVESLFSPLGTR